MSRKSSIPSLPAETLAQLDRRFLDFGFGDYSGHVAWLSELGFDISRSALHRYAQNNQARILQRSVESDAELATEVKVRCLEVAAFLESSTDSSTLIKNADDLLRWVYSR